MTHKYPKKIIGMHLILKYAQEIHYNHRLKKLKAQLNYQKSKR